MKVIILLLLTAYIATAEHQHGENLAKRQQDVNRLLYKINEPIRKRFSELSDASMNYIPHKHGSSFEDGGAAASRLGQEIEDKRVLQQHHWFSLFNNRHREEALMLFEILLNANNWETFANSAAYYRENLNEGVFCYGLYVSVIHSKIGQGIVLPSLYEITPHLFTNSEVIQKAYSAKMMQQPGKFRMSFTGTKKNPEQRIAYFGEDIGLNVHHVTWHMDYPFWWKDSYGYHLDRKGELFFWVHHQLTTRFDSERLSNNLDVVDELYWDKPIHEGFAPHTSYKFGGEFPARPDDIKFEDVDGVAKIRDMHIYESRIRDAIAHGYITGKDGNKIDIRNEKGIGILGDVIESSEYSPNTQYYGALHNLAHIILGRQGDPHGKFGTPPGVMEHFETATRDPAFFRLHKYMDNIFKEHKDSLPSYEKKDISFDGVVLKSFDISSKLVTFFEDFEFDIENAVDDTENIDDVPLSVVVSRLNHKPFHIDFNVLNRNDEDVYATFRGFLCPRRDANGIIFSFDEGRWNCIELDKFWKTLKPGVNYVKRHSYDASTTTPDIPSFKTLISKADCSVGTNTPLEISEYSRGCGIPNRLLLPKGNAEGFEFAIVYAITNGSEDAAIEDLEHNERGGSHTQCGIHGEIYPDKKPLGYPFDRKVPDARIYFESTNIKYKIVTVMHIN